MGFSDKNGLVYSLIFELSNQKDHENYPDSNPSSILSKKHQNRRRGFGYCRNAFSFCIFMFTLSDPVFSPVKEAWFYKAQIE